MIENRVSFNITEAQKTAFKEAADEVIAKAKPLETQISKEELKSLSKIADGRIPFVEKVAYFAVANPEFLPPFANVEEFQKDFKSFKDIREMLNPLFQVIQNLQNSGAVSGSEAYDFARNYYKAIKYNAEMGVPGAQAIYDQLRPLFEAKNKPSTQG